MRKLAVSIDKIFCFMHVIKRPSKTYEASKVKERVERRERWERRAAGRDKSRERQIIMCFTFQCLVKERGWEKRRWIDKGLGVWKGRQLLLRCFLSFKCKWEEVRGGPVVRERETEKVRKKKTNMWEGKRKEKWENPPTLTSLLFLKMTLPAVRMEWRMSGYLGFTCFLTQPQRYTQASTSSILSLQETNSN